MMPNPDESQGFGVPHPWAFRWVSYFFSTFFSSCFIGGCASGGSNDF